MIESKSDTSRKTAIRQFIQQSIATKDFDDDTDLFATRLVNSLFAIQLMTFLEKNFSIKVSMNDLDMNNFKSVNACAQFVRDKQKN